MKFRLLSSLCLTAFHLPGMAVAQLTDGDLNEPKSFSSKKGNLKIDLKMVEGQHTTVAASTFNTRMLGGTLPGPTIRVKPGQTLYVNFENTLEEQDGTSNAENNYAFPDSTNLHFHGPHVSSERPADDTTIIVDPGESFRYEVEFPSEHMGGTHWLHPHRHGSGMRQVSGGAASVLIVEDESGDVPPEVEDAKEKILMVQLFDTKEFEKIGDRDQLFQFEPVADVDDEFLLVNGQYQPVVRLRAGDWQRWRVVFGSWDETPLNLEIPDADDDCEINLLAKDGIYVDDYPREIDFYPIPTGGRADIMIRCRKPGTYQAKSYLGELFTLNVFEPSGEIDVSTPPTSNWDFPKPSYLTDLRNTSPSPGCSCDTYMNDERLNDLRFDKDVFLHTIALGSVVERTVTGLRDHPYHQHVYPFQLQEFYGTSDAIDAKYFKVGDYHDSLSLYSQNGALIRYLANNYKGRMVVHCHRLPHAERGMLSAELVVDPEDGGVCQCSPKFGNGGFTAWPTTAPTAAPTRNCEDESGKFKRKDSGKKSNCRKTGKLKGKKLTQRCKEETKNGPFVKEICEETCGLNGQGKCSFLKESRQSNNISV